MFRLFAAAGLAAAFCAGQASAAEVLEDFGPGSEARWEFVADGVMGGVSTGSAQVATVDGERAILITGEVSTSNNGGFIQVRRLLPEGLPEGTRGLRLRVRGNAEKYYVFIRTREMTRPWYYYNADFPTGAGWAEVDLPLSEFVVSHAHLAQTPDPAEIISVAIVAYGHDHTADIMVSGIKLY